KQGLVVVLGVEAFAPQPVAQRVRVVAWAMLSGAMLACAMLSGAMQVGPGLAGPGRAATR
ncbi:MAG TPA: hypothetical protein VKZ43_03235, partial [Trueperaceae bacterium]|nr:hypothetical protein [Trueperaceae bacterium]